MAANAVYAESDASQFITSDINDIFHLHVGEKHFTTTIETLTKESGYFAKLFTGPLASQLSAGKILMLDCDGELFSHILRYLRRGILPVFYDDSKGHDHALYLALLAEARHFQIHRLEKWLETKKYLQAVRLCYGVDMAIEVDGRSYTAPAGMQVELRPVEVTKRVYVCPRAIPVHVQPSDCGKKCNEKRGTGEVEYAETRVVNTMVVTKETIFNREMCLEDL